MGCFIRVGVPADVVLLRVRRFGGAVREGDLSLGHSVSRCDSNIVCTLWEGRGSAIRDGLQSFPRVVYLHENNVLPEYTRLRPCDAFSVEWSSSVVNWSLALSAILIAIDVKL